MELYRVFEVKFTDKIKTSSEIKRNGDIRGTNDLTLIKLKA